MKTLLRLSLKKTACRGKDTVGTGFSSNYRSFIFGKLPPPACPGLCYVMVCNVLLHSSSLCIVVSPLTMCCVWLKKECLWQVVLVLGISGCYRPLSRFYRLSAVSPSDRWFPLFHFLAFPPFTRDGNFPCVTCPGRERHGCPCYRRCNAAGGNGDPLWSSYNGR